VRCVQKAVQAVQETHALRAGSRAPPVQTQPDDVPNRRTVMLKSTAAPSFITATEAASRIGVSVDTIRRYCRDGTYKAEQRHTSRGMKWFVDSRALPAQAVPDVTQDIAEDALDAELASGAVVAALRAHNDDLRGQLDMMRAMIADKDKAHAAEIARLREDHAREVATLRDVNRDQYAILERLSVPRLPDSQSAAPRPWWRVW
jgi:DNA-binding transcriptional MerR regulator